MLFPGMVTWVLPKAQTVWTALKKINFLQFPAPVLFALRTTFLDESKIIPPQQRILSSWTTELSILPFVAFFRRISVAGCAVISEDTVTLKILKYAVVFATSIP